MSSTLSFPSKLGNSRPSSALQSKSRWRHRLHSRTMQICCIVVQLSEIKMWYPQSNWIIYQKKKERFKLQNKPLSYVKYCYELTIICVWFSVPSHWYISSLHLYFLSSFFSFSFFSNLPGGPPCLCLFFFLLKKASSVIHLQDQSSTW